MIHSASLLLILFTTQTASEATEEHSASQVPHCGVAAIYGMAKLLGIETTPEDIQNSIEKSNPGVDLSALSLSQIAEEFTRLGLYATPKQCDPADAVGLTPPFVAYYLPRRLAGVSKEVEGHVVIVTSLSPQGVRILDLTQSSIPIEMATPDFIASWDGHFLEVSRERTSTPVPYLRWGWGFLGAGALAVFLYSLKRTSNVRKPDQLLNSVKNN